MHSFRYVIKVSRRLLIIWSTPVIIDAHTFIIDAHTLTLSLSLDLSLSLESRQVA